MVSPGVIIFNRLAQQYLHKSQPDNILEGLTFYCMVSVIIVTAALFRFDKNVFI